MVEILEIDIEEFESEIYKEYLKLFPKEERRSFTNLKNAYEAGIEKFYKIILNNTIIGFLMLEKIKSEYPYYMDYFAIFESYQNKGYGTEAIKVLLDKIIENGGLFIEIEKEESNNPITIKRAKFYRELGFEKINSEYLLYNVFYTPYIYQNNANFDKEDVDRIMFEYYVTNCGKNAIKDNCKIIK